MGIGDDMDKIKNAAGEHSEQVDQGLDKASEFVDEKTGNKYGDQIDKARDQVEQGLGQQEQPDQPQ
jgi:antitoxin protein of toxin-antitoxin system